MNTHRRWHHMNETLRLQWQDPVAILVDAGLKPGQTFLDIGCGEGFFTLPAARIAGPLGKVYGLDIDGLSLEELRKKAESEGLKNLELKTGRAEEVILCESCADMVFLGIVLHDFQDPVRVLRNALRMLKRDGRLVNLDWKKLPMDFGPPVQRRFDEATASHLIESAGFKIEGIKDSGPYFYLITARPPELPF